MSAGLCSVLESIRRSMDSGSESENDNDVTDYVDPPSWHGSNQQLTNTPSTSESEMGNNSSESFLCDHCGNVNRGDNNSSGHVTSGRPPFSAMGRKRGCRPKKRAHFAVDTDNSSDADKMSDSHDSSAGNTFKPIPGSPHLVLSTSSRGSLSPREVKPPTPNDNRPSPSFARPASSVDITNSRGRQPFKANHELFKLPPSGSSTNSPLPSNQNFHFHRNTPQRVSTPVTSSGKPALPPRQIHKNHFKLQRRNSITNDERKAKNQTSHGNEDGTKLARPVRCTSATREVGRRLNDTHFHTPHFENNDSNNPPSVNHRSKSDASNPLNMDNSSPTVLQIDDNSRQLPNYDEAIQRASLLRWASLQKLPAKKSSSGELQSPTEPSLESSTLKSGYVGERVRSIEATKTTSFSSNSSVANNERINSRHRSTNSDWFGGSNSKEIDSVGNSPCSETSKYFGESPHHLEISKMSYQLSDDVIHRRKDDSNTTLSDDVFANDDSREHFADISWSPVILEENKFSEKGTHPLLPSNQHYLSPVIPVLKQKSKHRLAHQPLKDNEKRFVSHHDHNCNHSHTHSSIVNKAGGSVRNDISNNNNSNSNNNNNNEYPGESTTAPSVHSGKHIILEVLV